MTPAYGGAKKRKRRMAGGNAGYSGLRALGRGPRSVRPSRLRDRERPDAPTEKPRLGAKAPTGGKKSGFNVPA